MFAGVDISTSMCRARRARPVVTRVDSFPSLRLPRRDQGVRPRD